MTAEAKKTEAEWLSPAELAEWLGYPIKTIYRWNETGDGPKYHKIGKHVRYRRRDVEAWLESRKVERAS